VLELTRSPRLAFIASSAAVLVLFAGCGKKLDRAECDRLLDRYTELLVKDEEPEAAPERIFQAQARARQVAQKDSRFDFAACPSRVSRREYECAMTAPTVDAVERCLVF
jgi:hypothetical protein